MINLNNNRQHLPLIGKVGLAWRTTIFNGFIEVKAKVFFLQVTLCVIKKSLLMCMYDPPLKYSGFRRFVNSFVRMVSSSSIYLMFYIGYCSIAMKRHHG